MSNPDLEALDLLIERQRRAADDPDQGIYEYRAPWPVVPGWDPPPEPEEEETDDEDDDGGILTNAGPEDA
jgi:hypothetical protein